MATRKALYAEALALDAKAKQRTLADTYDASREIAASLHTLERSAKHFAEQGTIDALAARIRRLIPRWLRALLPVAAIARAVARFVEQTLDPYADDPTSDV